MRQGFNMLLLGTLLMFFTEAAWAQPTSGNNTIKTGPVRKRSPARAALLSAVLPGAGQIYNGKNWWWKVPVIYAAGGIFAYSVIFYNDNYNDFREAYKYRTLTGATVNGNERFDKFQTPTLKVIRDSYRQARDEAFLGLIIVYTLQIMDASVEAHLLEFDINDDLSLKVQPAYLPNSQFACAGIQVNLLIK